MKSIRLGVTKTSDSVEIIAGLIRISVTATKLVITFLGIGEIVVSSKGIEAGLNKNININGSGDTFLGSKILKLAASSINVASSALSLTGDLLASEVKHVTLKGIAKLECSVLSAILSIGNIDAQVGTATVAVANAFRLFGLKSSLVVGGGLGAVLSAKTNPSLPVPGNVVVEGLVVKLGDALASTNPAVKGPKLVAIISEIVSYLDTFLNVVSTETTIPATAASAQVVRTALLSLQSSLPAMLSSKVFVE